MRPPEARVGAGFRRQDAPGARETRMQGACVAALRMRAKTKHAAAQRGLGGRNLVPSRAQSADSAAGMSLRHERPRCLDLGLAVERGHGEDDGPPKILEQPLLQRNQRGKIHKPLSPRERRHPSADNQLSGEPGD
jgi:hypothetical protein